MKPHLDEMTSDDFYAGVFTDKELITFAEQTGVKTVNLELVQQQSRYPENRWCASMQSRASGFWQWNEASPLRAIAGVVIATHLADREAEAFYDHLEAMSESEGE